MYWDTSRAGGFDRINQAIQDSEYLGDWHHWAFVKNAETGQQEIYLDGMLWQSGGGLTKAMQGAKATVFHIGAGPTLANPYFGSLDDFRLYNTVLSQAEILWLAGRTEAIVKPF